MSKLQIITDSNSGITQQEGKDLGIFVIPMPFSINGEEFLEDINISQEQFYEYLACNAEVTTSQPSQAYLEELWSNLLQEYDELVYIPMSSGLSATCENAKSYALKYDDRVQVVDNLRISLGQKESVFEAIVMAKLGKSAVQIKEYLESTKLKSSTYIVMSTLKYIKRGGRIAPAAAAIGEILRIRPVLYTRGQAFKKFTVSTNFKNAKEKILAQLRKELESEFAQEYKDGKMTISVAYTKSIEEALRFKEDIEKEFPDLQFHFVDPLSLSVACHIGPNALGVAISINNYM